MFFYNNFYKILGSKTKMKLDLLAIVENFLSKYLRTHFYKILGSKTKIKLDLLAIVENFLSKYQRAP